eukprot:TRINITY_DN1498_c0_g1_i2.p1 TRINITY_DN1498_c0_g1~~TRINITY_DN1498_c0_g1_i2.p1  ORF type:complete len:252 (+),score=18.03 TRINITY_DN1498_c0_g1_i2:478-1233(+)
MKFDHFTRWFIIVFLFFRMLSFLGAILYQGQTEEIQYIGHSIVNVIVKISMFIMLATGLASWLNVLHFSRKLRAFRAKVLHRVFYIICISAGFCAVLGVVIFVAYSISNSGKLLRFSDIFMTIIQFSMVCFITAVGILSIVWAQELDNLSAKVKDVISFKTSLMYILVISTILSGVYFALGIIFPAVDGEGIIIRNMIDNLIHVILSYIISLLIDPYIPRNLATKIFLYIIYPKQFSSTGYNQSTSQQNPI